MTSQRAVIAGASHAGAQLAASLRQEGWAGEIVLIGDESMPPYQRPPLSKAYLSGKSALDELALRSAEIYRNQRIQCLDAAVQAVDRSNCRLSLSNGDAMPCDMTQCPMTCWLCARVLALGG